VRNSKDAPNLSPTATLYTCKYFMISLSSRASLILVIWLRTLLNEVGETARSNASEIYIYRSLNTLRSILHTNKFFPSSNLPHLFVMQFIITY